MQMSAHALAALAHSQKSPVAGALTSSEDGRVHPNSIIAYANRKLGIAISDVGFYMSGLCMLVRIADRFTSDVIGLVSNYGIQLTGPALNDYTVFGF